LLALVLCNKNSSEVESSLNRFCLYSSFLSNQGDALTDARDLSLLLFFWRPASLGAGLAASWFTPRTGRFSAQSRFGNTPQNTFKLALGFRYGFLQQNPGVHGFPYLRPTLLTLTNLKTSIFTPVV
jgi:hypothetical protein